MKVGDVVSFVCIVCHKAVPKGQLTCCAECEGRYRRSGLIQPSYVICGYCGIGFKKTISHYGPPFFCKADCLVNYQNENRRKGMEIVKRIQERR